MQSYSPFFHPSSFAKPLLLVSSSLLRSAREEPPRDAKPRIELGPTLRNTNWLRRTLTDLRRTLLSYAAPYWAKPHPNFFLLFRRIGLFSYFIFNTASSDALRVRLCRRLPGFVTRTFRNFWRFCCITVALKGLHNQAAYAYVIKCTK